MNVKAIAPTKLCTLTKDKMKNIILRRPEIGLKILGVVGEKLMKLEALAQNLATNDIQTRIAHLLLDLKAEYGKITSRGVEIKIPITREDMSNYTGVARETVTRKLKNLRRNEL